MKQTVCILFGGNSSEHEISCLSAGNVLSQIDHERFDVIKVGIDKSGTWFLTEATPEEVKTGEWTALNNKTCVFSPNPKHHGLLVFNKNGDVSVTYVDVVFPVLHGKNGEDGTVQGLFELGGVPYVGPGVLASALCMDKVMAKEVLSRAGIAVTEGFFVRRQYNKEAVHKRIEASFGYPVVIKPSRSGSSVGVTLVESFEALEKGLQIAAAEDDKILIERAVDGREIECAVLGNTQFPQASCLGEIVNEGLYDYDTKYVSDTAGLLIPADLDEETTKNIQEIACLAFMALGCQGLSRVDFFVDRKTGQILINEINTLPGFTNISMYPRLWEESGLSYKDLITRLVDLAE